MNSTMIDRKQRVEEAKKDYISLFSELKIEDPFFNLKPEYYRNNDKSTQALITFYPSEMRLRKDMYVEVMDPGAGINRKANKVLFKYTYNPSYDQIYPLEMTPTGAEMYLIPLSDMEVVNRKVNVPQEGRPRYTSELVKAELRERLEEEDAHMDAMTLRTHACLELGIPETKFPWLNDLIEKSNKRKGI